MLFERPDMESKGCSLIMSTTRSEIIASIRELCGGKFEGGGILMEKALEIEKLKGEKLLDAQTIKDMGVRLSKAETLIIKLKQQHLNDSDTIKKLKLRVDKFKKSNCSKAKILEASDVDMEERKMAENIEKLKCKTLEVERLMVKLQERENEIKKLKGEKLLAGHTVAKLTSRNLEDNEFSKKELDKETDTCSGSGEMEQTESKIGVEKLEKPKTRAATSSVEKHASKQLPTEKGRGTTLKDIPNVKHNLSKMKADGTLKLLHTILFEKRVKAAQIKNNISRFSGLVLHGDEEKQMAKVREKLNKCIKDKLVELCGVLDITVSKNARKDDMIEKLLDFLVEPHATTTSGLLTKKDQQSANGKKRKWSSSSEISGSTALKGSSEGFKQTGKSSEKEPTRSKKKILQVERPTKEKSRPNENELRNALSEILKGVNLNTATFTDILRLLVVRFNADLMPMKSMIKGMITDELIKLADAEDDAKKSSF